MATEFNYVVNVDTTRVMGAMSEVRSQMGMALGGVPSQFSPQSAMGQMMSGLERGVMRGFGITHTDPAMAYNPNYGQVFAGTSHAQEQAVVQHGLAAAQAMRPPGVSAYEFAMGAHGNAIDRQQRATHAAKVAAQSTFFSGMGGLAAGELAFLGAGAIGGRAGAGIATKLFGSGAAGAGKLLGGLGLGMAAFGIAEEAVGGRIRSHFAEAEQIGGVTRELGDIVGGGRGLGRLDKYNLGVAARGAAKDVGMSVQQMGDIASLARNTGMLPGTTDPSKLRGQLGDLAKAVDEGASALHTSLANAAMVIRSASKQGLSAEEGIMRAGAAGGAEQYLAGQARYQAFGAAGGQFALQQRLTQRQGFQVFTGALGQAAGAGISSGAMQVLGGRYGAAQLIGAGQIAAATSPLGDLQMMAAAGGQPLGGMMDLPGQALSAMSGGDGLLTNMMRFQVHKDELRRGIGAGGIRTMARQQMAMGGEMIRSFAPGLSEREANAMFMQSQGLDPTQAWAYAGGVGGGGGRGGAGGGGGAAYARRLETFQGMQMHRAGRAAAAAEKSASDFSFGGMGVGDAAVTGAVVGGTIGSGIPVIGTAIGAGLGAAAGAGIAFGRESAGAIKSVAGSLFGDGPGVFASAQERADYANRQQAAAYDAQMAATRSRYGAVDLDPNIAAGIRSAPLSRSQISMDPLGAAAASRFSGYAALGGLSPVEAGPGTTTVHGVSYRTEDLRRAEAMLDKPAKYTQEAKDLAYQAVVINRGAEMNTARATMRREASRIASGSFVDAGAPFTAEQAREAKQVSMSRYLGARQTIIEGMGIETAVDPQVLKGALDLAVGGPGYRSPAFNARIRGDIQRTAGAGEAADMNTASYVNYLASLAPVSDARRSSADMRVRNAAFAEALTEKAGFLAAIDKGNMKEVGRLMREEGLRPKYSGVDVEGMFKNMKAGGSVSIEPAVAIVDIFTAGYASKAIEAAGEDVVKAFSSPMDLITETRELLGRRGDKSIEPEGRKRKRRSRGEDPFIKRIGFGQQETALSSILQSLKHTERALKDLNKQNSKTPVAGNNALDPLGLVN